MLDFNTVDTPDLIAISMPNPEVNETLSTGFTDQVQVRRSMSGTFQTVLKPVTNEIYTWTWSKLTSEKCEGFANLVKGGGDFNVLDWRRRFWTLRLMSDESINWVEEGPDSFRLTFEFEGTYVQY